MWHLLLRSTGRPSVRARAPEPSPDRRTRILVALLVLLGVALCALIWETERPPIERWGYIGIEGFTYRTAYNTTILGVLTAVTALALAVYGRWERGGITAGSVAVRWAATVLPLLLVGSAAVLYFYGSRVARLHYPWFHDSYHYYLGAKYFPELGYDKLYACHLLADSQRPERRYEPTDRVTDLRDDSEWVAWKVQAQADCGAFTPERWREFQGDVTFFDLNADKDILRDRGYNGSPFHTLVASSIANLGPVSYQRLLALTFVDIAGIVLMLAVIAWAFGFRTGSLFALFFFTNFADRFNFVGASFLRYQWVVCLGIGIALMHRKRYGPAAVLMTAAAMLNIFPVLFLAGIGVKIAIDMAARRRLEPVHRSFLLWSVIAAILFGAASLAQSHPFRNYQEFLSGMSKHSEALTPMRVGLRYDFILGRDAEAPDAGRGQDRSDERLDRIRSFYWPVALALVVVGLLVASRLDDVSATVLAGFLLFFALFGTVTYYYAVTAFLLLVGHERRESSAALIFPALLFGLTALIYVAWYVTDNDLGFLNNTAMSWMLTIYVLALLAYEGRRGRGGLLARWRGVGSAAAAG